MSGDRRSEDFHAVSFKVLGKDIGIFCIKFEWIMFINNGHRFFGSFGDTHGNAFPRDFIDKILDKSKSDDGVDVEVQIFQKFDKSGKQTTKRKLKVLTLSSQVPGGLTTPVFDFVCIDGASWKLNRGECKGKAYKGNISSVIKQIAQEYGVSAQVDETKDDKNNWWWDMKLDPKTVITSLLEWSSVITSQKSPFVIQSQDDEFLCKEWSSLQPITNGKKFKVMHPDGDEKEINNYCDLEILNNSFLTPSATRLYTGSISATSGLYIDRDNVKDEEYFVDDQYTSIKLGTSISKNQGYKGSDSKYGTFIHAIPEHNNGDVGLKYQDYAVGRAREWFIKTIYTTMRVKVMIEPGDTDFDNIKSCGRDKIILEAVDLEKVPYYIDGPWLLYGIKHYGASYDDVSVGNWQTELHLSRLDFDAIQKAI